MSTPFIHMLKTPLGCYLYDVNTNQTVEVGESVYKYLEKVEKLGEAAGNPEPEVERQLERLRKKGMLLTCRPSEIVHPLSDLLEYYLDTDIEQVTLQVTQDCNFRCAYCAYAVPDFATQRQHSPKKMSLETAKAAIDFFVRHSVNRQEVIIGFYGGEPLLEFELIREAALYAERAFQGKMLTFTLTTNGSLFTPEIMDFFSKHAFHILVSLDGDPERHDRSRKFARTGEGTFAVIEKNLLRIQKEYPVLYQKIRINAVLDPRYSTKELYGLFEEDGEFSGLDLRTAVMDDEFSVEKVIPSETYRIESSQDRFKVYMALLGKIPEESVPKAKLTSVKAALSLTEQAPPRIRLGESAAPGGPCVPGQRRLFVNVDGDFYPCERVSESSAAMKIGSLSEGFDYEQARKLLNIGQLTAEDCKNCWAFSFCSLCARVCDNEGELSAELKRSRCRSVREAQEESMKELLMLSEMKERAQRNGAAELGGGKLVWQEIE